MPPSSTKSTPPSSALGLDVRAIGPTTVAVHALPRLLSRAKPESVVRDLIAEVTRIGRTRLLECGRPRAGDDGLPRFGARRRSPFGVGGERALLVALDQVDFSGHCPHGRPIVTRIGWDELERKVGRR